MWKTACAFALAVVASGLPRCTASDPSTDRQRMIDRQLIARGISDPRVLDAMRTVPRHEFMPVDVRSEAYEDNPVPIGWGQTISQPYIVAFMTEKLAPKPGDRVLEIGTGSGYQAAILARLVKEVYSIEIVEPLGLRAADDLKRLGFENVRVKIGDGYAGWPEFAPFDSIIVTCAPDRVPPALAEQLREGGRMIIPVGDRRSQELYLREKRGGKIEQRAVLPVRFVPMTGRAQSAP
jgi:protein-L-isoaspartate(D-aspartate) O-methyltransferase